MAERKTSAGGEAHIIETYFAPLTRGLAGTFDLRDDCAALSVPPGFDVVVKTDPVRAGVHFMAETDAADIGWKALAVNVSDLAAKGATPVAYLLALSFPQSPTASWLKRFAAGLAEAQSAFGIVLAGGDTDRAPGPLSIGVTVFGTVPAGRMVRRGSAQPGDSVWVTGTLGDAALGLDLVRDPMAAVRLGLLSHHCDAVLARYDRPQPRLAARDLLLDCAHAAMDLSDGLMKDAGRMAAASGVGMTLRYDRVPLSPALQRAVARDAGYRVKAVAHGDDYEILFTTAAGRADEIRARAASLPFAVTEIGTVTVEGGVALVDAAGATIAIDHTGWDHF